MAGPGQSWQSVWNEKVLISTDNIISVAAELGWGLSEFRSLIPPQAKFSIQVPVKSFASR